MYKTKILKEIGGFDEDNLTEDMEIAFRLQKNGYVIENSSNAYVNTASPATLPGLIRQRIRWFVGFIDNIKNYKTFVLNPKYGSLGMYMLPMSVAWIGVLFYTMIKLFSSVINGIEYPLKTLFLTGFRLDLIIKRIMEEIYLQPTFMTWFILIFLALGIMIILISLWTSNEKVDFKNKYVHYVSFMFIYTFLLATFWFASLAYMVVRNRTKNKIKW
jgi:cellulose synthase/poly-beta-1,6-N-acetylglucosamine synthase-like glycosyltransferase